MNKFRDIGLKLTPQRIAILEYLEKNSEHPSVEDIHRAVTKKFPTMSLATVYTTMSALGKKGNVLELNLDPDKKRYDPRTESHGHLICISCRQIIDLPQSTVPDPPQSGAKEFTIIRSQVEAYGFCRECHEKNIKAVEETADVR